MTDTTPPANAIAIATPETAAVTPAALGQELLKQGLHEALALLERQPDDVVARTLADFYANLAVKLLWELPEERRARIFALVPPETRAQWLRNREYPEETVGRLMDPPIAVFRPDQTVADAVAELRDLVRLAFVTYGYVTDSTGRLIGVIVFRELLFADDRQRLAEVMLRDPFWLRPEMPILEAAREVLRRHYPVYPVCDAAGRLLGIVRGQTLFEHQAFELSAQAGSMVGVEKEERISTPWWRSLRFRHPWLQFNLLTAFLAAAVVGAFEATIDQVVALAVFLPVLAGQSGNTGCQALAVTLRGLTLGEIGSNGPRTLVGKEAWLGFLNGLGTGLMAALGMLAFTFFKGHSNGPVLALVVLLAMVASCVASGVSGALIPVTLRRLGADPATASSIFLTTATDVASMGLFLALATILVL
jgi:magnesium transporter